jgi:RNA polymerase sigma-B factor
MNTAEARRPGTREAGDPDQLWAAYASHPDYQLREQLIEHYRPLAIGILHRMPGRWDEDLEQVALLGLVKAVDRFNPACGTRFGSFAVPTIQGEVKRYLRDYSRPVRCPRPLLDLRAAMMTKERELTLKMGHGPTLSELAEALNVELDQVVEAMAIEETCHPHSLDRLLPVGEQGEPVPLEECIGEEDPELARAEQRILWNEVLERLEPALQQVVQLRFYQNLTQQEAAHRLGVSQMQVSRLERRALERLRAQMAIA